MLGADLPDVDGTAIPEFLGGTDLKGQESLR
jgi:hypothetical protein